jgi:methionyl-tRNA formyltransferase
MGHRLVGACAATAVTPSPARVRSLMRVALISRVARAVTGLSSVLRGLGHEPVGVLTTALGGDRYGTDTLGAIAEQAAGGFDVVVAGSPSRIGPLLAALDADLAVSVAFPLLIPADALSVPRLGIVNTHPSLLPRYRGPNPIAWTVRNGDRELGYSIHRMDRDFDTGHLLAQGTTPIHDAEQPEDIFERMFTLLSSLLPAALGRVEAGDPGDPQPAQGASYAGFFEPEYAEIDWTRGRAEIQRQVLAWGVAAVRPGLDGARATLDGQRVRVLRVRDDDTEGGTRMECADGPLWLVTTEPA